jgi:hypothetical protein
MLPALVDRVIRYISANAFIKAQFLSTSWTIGEFGYDNNYIQHLAFYLTGQGCSNVQTH